MGMWRRIVAGVAGLGLGLVLAAPAWATLDNVKAYKQAYPGKEPKAYSCKTCHQNAVGKKGDLNAYGLALQESKGAGQALKLAPEDFKAIETQDSDKDGATNLQEIESGTAPGDPASVPPGTIAPAAAAPEAATSSSEAPAVTDEAAAAAAPQAEPGTAASIGEEAPAEPTAAPSADTPSPSSQGTLDRIQAYLDGLLAPAAWADESASEGPAPKAEYVGNETCASCHPGQHKSFSRGTHASVTLPDDEGRVIGCESCHGAGSLHVEEGGKKSLITRHSPDQCFSCHMEKRAQFQLQFHHPVPEGRMACTDCHQLHGTDARATVPTSLTRSDETCVRCHKELRGPFVFEHDAMREGCGTCHEPHGAPFDKMLVASESSLCLRCHWEQAVDTTTGQFGGVLHGNHVEGKHDIGRGEECIDHHRAPHGSNIWRTFNR